MSNNEELHDLRIEAVYLLEALAVDQIALWDELEKVVEAAGDNFVVARQNYFSEKSDSKSGYPLWATIVLSVAISVLPLQAIAAWGATKIITRSRYFFGRIGVDKGAVKIIKAVKGPLVIKPTPLDRRVSLDFLENDKATLRILKVINPDAEGKVKSYAKDIIKTGTAPLFDASGKAIGDKTEVVLSTSKDTSLVAIKEPLYDWIRNTRQVEQTSIAALKKYFQIDKKLDLDNVKEEVAKLKVLSEANPSKWGGPNPRKVFQHHVEACIWATTFNFNPTRRKRDDVGKYPDPFLAFKGVPDVITTLHPPRFSAKFWEDLTSRLFEDPKNGKTYKDQGIRDSRWVRGQPMSPSLRLAIDLFDLSRKIKKENIAIAKAISGIKE